MILFFESITLKQLTTLIAGMGISPGNNLLIGNQLGHGQDDAHVTMHQLVITFRGKINDKNKGTSIFFKPVALYTHTTLQPM